MDKKIWQFFNKQSLIFYIFILTIVTTLLISPSIPATNLPSTSHTQRLPIQAQLTQSNIQPEQAHALILEANDALHNLTSKMQVEFKNIMSDIKLAQEWTKHPTNKNLMAISMPNKNLANLKEKASPIKVNKQPQITYPNVILKNTPISNISLIGTMLQNTKKWAIIMSTAKNSDKMLFNVSIGDRISQNQALIKDITENYIVLEKNTPNNGPVTIMLNVAQMDGNL